MLSRIKSSLRSRRTTAANQNNVMAVRSVGETPTGWEKKTGSKGKTFYYHKRLKFVQWHFPTDEDVEDPEGAKERARQKQNRDKKERDSKKEDKPTKHACFAENPIDSTSKSSSATTTSNEMQHNGTKTGEQANQGEEAIPAESEMPVQKQGGEPVELEKLAEAANKASVPITFQEAGNSNQTPELSQAAGKTVEPCETGVNPPEISKATNSSMEDSLEAGTSLPEFTSLPHKVTTQDFGSGDQPLENENSSSQRDDVTLEKKDDCNATTLSISLTSNEQNIHGNNETPPIITIHAWEALPDGTVKGEIDSGHTFHTQRLLTAPVSNSMIRTINGFAFQLGDHKSVAKKRKRSEKHKKGDYAKSVKQVKDAQTRLQAGSFVVKAVTYQKMSRYETSDQNLNNPTSNTYVINRDEIVAEPSKGSLLNCQREKAQWTCLVPEGVDEDEFFQDIENLHKELVASRKKRAKVDSDPKITHDPSVYLDRLYGQDAGLKLITKIKEEDLEKAKAGGKRLKWSPGMKRDGRAFKEDEDDAGFVQTMMEV